MLFHEFFSFNRGPIVIESIFFEVVILVEQGDVDEAELRVGSLRKHLERHGGTERERTIYRLLRQQSRHFFSFEGFEEEEGWLAELSGAGKWDPAGKEVIRFDTWYRSHRDGS